MVIPQLRNVRPLAGRPSASPVCFITADQRQCDPVAGAKDIFYLDLHIGERPADLADKSFELLRTMKFSVSGVLPAGDPVGGEQFIDGFGSALIPHFLEPASHELDIFFDGHRCVLLSSDFSGTPR